MHGSKIMEKPSPGAPTSHNPTEYMDNESLQGPTAAEKGTVTRARPTAYGISIPSGHS